MSTVPDTAATPTLHRTDVLHRTLALCAETDAITRDRWPDDVQVVWLRKVAPSNALVHALNVLARTSLVCWYDAPDESGMQYGDVTPKGLATLHRWDAELLGGGA